MPVAETADSRWRFDNTPTALLSVSKPEIHTSEEQIDTVQQEKVRRHNRAIDRPSRFPV
jgi:hypothetical protein